MRFQEFFILSPWDPTFKRLEIQVALDGSIEAYGFNRNNRLGGLTRLRVLRTIDPKCVNLYSQNSYLGQLNVQTGDFEPRYDVESSQSKPESTSNLAALERMLKL